MKSHHHGCIPWLSKEALTKSRYEKIGFLMNLYKRLLKLIVPLKKPIKFCQLLTKGRYEKSRCAYETEAALMNSKC